MTSSCMTMMSIAFAFMAIAFDPLYYASTLAQLSGCKNNERRFNGCVECVDDFSRSSFGNGTLYLKGSTIILPAHGIDYYAVLELWKSKNKWFNTELCMYDPGFVYGGASILTCLAGKSFTQQY